MQNEQGVTVLFTEPEERMMEKHLLSSVREANLIHCDVMLLFLYLNFRMPISCNFHCWHDAFGISRDFVLILEFLEIVEVVLLFDNIWH